MQQKSLFSKPRLKHLQDLQTEIYRQLQLLIPVQLAHHDSFQSQVPGSPLLRMDILERHPYTHFLRMTYQFNDNQQQDIEPDAHIRIYNDACLAEATSFNHEQGFKRLAEVNFLNGSRSHPPPVPAWYSQHHLFQRSWRQNQTLDKWLGYLLDQGHSSISMQPSDDRISGKQTISFTKTATAVEY